MRMKHETLYKRVRTKWVDEYGIEYSVERTVRSDQDDTNQRKQLEHYKATGLVMIGLPNAENQALTRERQ